MQPVKEDMKEESRSQTESAEDTKIKVCLVAWFLGPHRCWIGEYLDDSRYECTYVNSPFRVDIRNRRTGLLGWLLYFFLAVRARWALARNRYDVVVTAFPQVAVCVALLNRLTGARVRHIAWYFNCGHRYKGLRLWISRLVFQHVDRFVVYTRQECENYSSWFSIPKERFCFTYLTGVELDAGGYSGAGKRFGIRSPYLISAGSSSRDFKTLFDATKDLKLPLVVVTHPYALEELEIPGHVRVIKSVSQTDYLSLVEDALLSIIPVNNKETASGQMTLIQSFALATPTVATRCIGTEDYIIDRQTGIFIEPGDVPGMQKAIQEMLSDSSLYHSIQHTARAFAVSNFFDSSLGNVFEGVYKELCRDEKAIEVG
jgi:glycosyltransferase involved in cell wall biosynthesis